MFSIFHGERRGIGISDREIFLKVGVDFRKHLHHFKGAKWSIFTNLTLHMNQQGWAIVPIRTIAKETGYNPQTIMTTTRDLNSVFVEGRRVLYTVQVRGSDGLFCPNWSLIFPTDQEIADLDAFVGERSAVLLSEIQEFTGLSAKAEAKPVVPVVEVEEQDAPLVATKTRKQRQPRQPKPEPVVKVKGLTRRMQEAYYEFEPGMSWQKEAKGAERIQKAIERLGWTDEQIIERSMQCVRYYDSQWSVRASLTGIAGHINKWVEQGMPKAPNEQQKPAEEASYVPQEDTGPVILTYSTRVR